MSNTALRIQRHAAIRELVISSRFEQALIEFEKTIQLYGPHIGLLCDYAGCYYESGQYQECWILVQKIEEEYSNNREILSIDSQRRTLLFLGKLYEEMAEPALALQSYTQAESLEVSVEDHKWIFANQLRLYSYFNKKSLLQQKYETTLELNKSVANLQIESIHSLMWAEWSLFGYQQALNYWLTAQTLEMNVLDKRIFSRDFIEISILSNITNTLDQILAQEMLLQSNPQDYDFALISLLNFDCEKNLNLIPLSLSTMMRLKLLLLNFRLSKNKNEQIELRKKYLFLIEGRSKEAQEFFKGIDISIDSQMERFITVHVSDKTLHFENGEPIKMTRLQIQLLSSFISANKVNLDVLSKNLWQTEQTESIYHRLRMLIYKINDVLNPLLGFIPFEIKKEGVSAHSLLKIKVK